MLNGRGRLWRLGCALVLVAAQGCQRVASKHEAAQAISDASRAAHNSTVATAQARVPVEQDGMVLIEAGTYTLGTDEGMPYEAPAHAVALNSFWLDKHEVTVAEFARFVAATGYQTDAEKFNWSGVFNLADGTWERVGRG